MSAADAGEPVLAASSAPSLLLQTLGPAFSAAAAASPSKAHEMLLQGISQSLSQKGSEELVEQARLTAKSHGDIRNLYQDDGAKLPAANGKSNQQGRRPGLGRKRPQFSLKSTASNTVQTVDFSVLENIEDPVEYFLAVERLEKAEKELKRLRGEAPTELAENHQAINVRKRQPGILGRKSVYTYQLPVGADTSNTFEVPLSQRGTLMKAPATEQEAPALHLEKVKQSVASKSSQHEQLNGSEREEPIAEKDRGVTLDDLLSSFKNLDKGEEENLLQKSLQLKQISIGKVCLPEFNFPGDGLQSSNAVRNNPVSHVPERSISRSPLGRLSELKRRISLGNTVKDNCADISKDDESEDSPEIATYKQSLVCTADGASLMTAKDSHAMEINEETQIASEKSPEHVLELELDILDRDTAGGGQLGNSPHIVCRGGEIIKEKDASIEHHFSFEQGDNAPLDSPVVVKSNREHVVPSSHSLEAISTEALASAPCINVVPNSGSSDASTCTILHVTDDSSQHKVPASSRKVVEGEITLQDKSSHPLEVAPTDIDPVDYIQQGNIEEQTGEINNAVSPSKGRKQNAAQKKKKKQETDRRKSLADAGLAWQSGVRRSTRVRSRPLQHWLGERFLYGRIHHTMATVIGVKSYSPGQDAKKATMRVKSFVPDQYADIVAQAAK